MTALLAVCSRNILYWSSRNARVSSQLRCCSSSSKDLKNPTVVLSQDGSTVVCWHPEKSFPYELSRPLPRRESEIRQGDTVLKAQYVLDEKNKNRRDGPTQEELMKIFHTTRHAFDHKPTMRYRKKNPPKDRDSI